MFVGFSTNIELPNRTAEAYSEFINSTNLDISFMSWDGNAQLINWTIEAVTSSQMTINLEFSDALLVSGQVLQDRIRLQFKGA